MSLYFKLIQQLYPSVSDRVKLPYTPQFRIEGRSRNPNNTDALSMRTADPLWMLGRQWQFGEFKGEDNGSPIQVKTFYRKEQAEAYSKTKDENAERHALNGIPLEAMIESIPIQVLDLKSRVRIGQQYERLIRQYFRQENQSEIGEQLILDLRDAFPLEREVWLDQGEDIQNEEKLDAKSLRFFNLMQGKVVGGAALMNEIGTSEAYPKSSRFSASHFSALASVTTQLRRWYKELFVQAEDSDQAWNAQQLVHEFKVHHKKEDDTLNGFTINAPDYQSGHLDWYSFDNSTIRLNPKEGLEASEKHLPVNVSFASMPDKRLFSFEDSKIDLSLMDVDSSDLLKMMILDFSLVSGSDWFTVPLEMKLGEACWIDRIEVEDVFGVRTIIKNDGQKGAILNTNPLKVWDVFKIRDFDTLIERTDDNMYKEEEHFLFIAPSTTFRMESQPVEELLFIRDEYANMVWAIEKQIPNALGKSVDGFDLHLELYGPFQTPDADEENEDSIPKFRLANSVPSNWIPYLPSHIEDDATNIELRRAYMLRNDDSLKDIQPLSFLAKEDILKIREEAIPKAGVRVQVTNQRIRWTDGKTYVWKGRKVLTGRGEGNSGLRFDYLKT